MSKPVPGSSEKPEGGSSDKPKPVGKKSLLLDYVDKKVCVITNDGRNIIGTLLGFDQVCNVILQSSEERIFSSNAGVQVVALGLYVIRGDNIAILGEIDLELDAKTPWDKTKVRSLLLETIRVLDASYGITIANQFISLHRLIPCMHFLTQGNPLNPVVH